MLCRRFTEIVILIFLLLIFFGCKNKNSNKSESTFPREETLYISGFLWGAVSGFNPLDDDPSFPVTSDVNLVYESMFGYNLLSGELEGIIAKEYMLDDKTLTVFLNENAKWQDGIPITADDVVYTFELHKKYPTSLNSHWDYISSVVADGANTVVFTLSSENYNPLVMKEIISSTYILPKHIFKSIEDSAIKSAQLKAGEGNPVSPKSIFDEIKLFKNNKDVVGSGPFTILSFSDEKVILKRVDSYWGTVMHAGKLPAVKYIIHPIFKSNSKFNLALLQGDIDISQDFVPQIWNKFKKGVGTWYKEKPYYVPGSIPAMLMQLTKAPFSNKEFRRAVAYAIDYEQILNFSIYGYAPALKPGLIIDYGPEKQYFNGDDAKKFGVTHNTEKARQILASAGYKWNSEGKLLSKSGKPFSTLTVTCPRGWTDWESVVKTFVEGLTEIGLDVEAIFQDEAIWRKNAREGNFDFTMYAPFDHQSAASPWARFDAVMSSADWAPIGEPMWQNLGRYKNPVADSLLKIIPKLFNDNEVIDTYREINRLFMKELPVIPLMYRPWFFYEFSTKHWKNFPTEENPHSPPQCLIVGAGINGLWNIEPNSK